MMNSPRVLIESSNANHNWGDASMLHAAIGRVRTVFPGSTITLLKPHSAYETMLQAQTVESVSNESRAAWHTQRPLWYRLDEVAPHWVDVMHARWPRVTEALTQAKMKGLGRDVAARGSFIRLFEEAALLLVSGGGFITDAFASAEKVLNIILLAKSKGVPVAMVGQGIGPLRATRLREKAAFALPQVDLIALRERRASKPLLRELGCESSRITVTGDDAVQLAYPERSEALGTGIGVNLRLAFYSNVHGERVDELGRVLARMSEHRSAPLYPVPIAYEGHGSDVETNRRVMEGAGVSSDGGAALDSVEAVVRQVGKCRVVVTGSYHGGVFALSQGIPVVALSGSEYYDNKFQGLADMFGTGCTVLRTDREGFAERLQTAIETAWKRAPEMRADLLEAARQQIEAAEAAYGRLPGLITSAHSKEVLT